jgi:hypothetical protein
MRRDDSKAFAKTIAAARRYKEADTQRSAADGLLSQARWDLGDALIAECGAPGDNGVRTGAYKLLKQAASVLKKEGLSYHFDHLRDLRQVAHQFPAGDRSPAEASWTVHRAAGSPDKLRKIIDAAKAANKPLTRKFASRWVKANKHANDPPPDHDPADTAIFEELLISVAAETALQFTALLQSPLLAKIDPLRAFDIAHRWDVVASLAQEIQTALHKRMSDTAMGEAAE